MQSKILKSKRKQQFKCFVRIITYPKPSAVVTPFSPIDTKVAVGSMSWPGGQDLVTMTSQALQAGYKKEA